jgi:hypothetical protein
MALAIVVSIGCASTAAALEISEKTYVNYQDYLKLIGSTKKGAFAVAADGYGSYFTYCSDVGCDPLNLAHESISKCSALTGTKCVLLAYGRDERIEYTVVKSRTSLSDDDEILANILPADRLKAFIVGNTMQGEYPNHQKWMEHYTPDGKIRGKADQLGSFKGRYEFKDNVICYYYDGHSDWNWCSQISVIGDTIYFLEDGKLVTNESNTQMLQGNPYNL